MKIFGIEIIVRKAQRRVLRLETYREQLDKHLNRVCRQNYDLLDGRVSDQVYNLTPFEAGILLADLAVTALERSNVHLFDSDFGRLQLLLPADIPPS